ncbi:envelope stress response membrane protein PspC [Aliikangiella sp. IMCC44359]|uniref:envelope stress response membrane protein PspC n=1 Tax=Aliikangiella sp. IMCC44359 TaxID=3459125 RepID=UPI00403ADA40
MSESSRKLYKNPDKAKICGVCAGLAEYFGFEVWVVRIIAISLLVFNWFNGTVLLAYFVLYFVLDPKPGSKSNKGCFGKERKRNLSEYAEESKPYKPSVKEVWRTGISPKDKLDEIESKFSMVESKLQNIESFVTSKQFELEKEFNKMK